MNRMKQFTERGKTLVKGFTPGQRAVVIAAALVVVLGAYALARWAAQPDWAMLASDLSAAEAQAITDELSATNVRYKLAENGTAIMVPQSQVYTARLDVAGKGISASGSDAWSILDQQSITATELQQDSAYQRGLEAELATTLGHLTGVQAAVVHLAVPKDDVFATETDRTTAAVLLQLSSGTTLTSNQVTAVTQLVSRSVPELAADDVSVTDQDGTLLSGAEDGTAAAGDNDTATAAKEARLSQAGQAVLDKLVGSGNAVVRVNADLNFDDTTTVADRYESTAAVPPTAWATQAEVYNGDLGASGGALGQIWPTLAPVQGDAQDAQDYGKWQATAEQPVDRTLSTAKVAPGGVRRLTVSVVMDQTKAASLDTQVVQELVANAVGLDAARGDTITVSAMPFDTTTATEAAAELKAAQAQAQTAMYIDLAQKVGIALLVLVAAFLLFRRRKKDEVTAVATDLPFDTSVLGTAQQQMLAPAPAAKELPESAEDRDEALRRDQVRDEMSMLVNSQPEEVAHLIQGWLTDRKG